MNTQSWIGGSALALSSHFILVISFYFVISRERSETNTRLPNADGGEIIRMHDGTKHWSVVGWYLCVGCISDQPHLTGNEWPPNDWVEEGWRLGRDWEEIGRDRRMVWWYNMDILDVVWSCNIDKNTLQQRKYVSEVMLMSRCQNCRQASMYFQAVTK